MFDKEKPKQRGWGRPKGSVMSEEAKGKISKAVKESYRLWKEAKDKADKELKEKMEVEA